MEDIYTMIIIHSVCHMITVGAWENYCTDSKAERENLTIRLLVSGFPVSRFIIISTVMCLCRNWID